MGGNPAGDFGILRCLGSGYRSNLRKSWPPSLRLPFPKQLENLAMPPNQRFWFDDYQGLWQANCYFDGQPTRMQQCYIASKTCHRINSPETPSLKMALSVGFIGFVILR